MQPLVMDGSVARFRKNEIVRRLLDEGPFTMNDIACWGASDEDRMQFAQLIGYSVGGYSELSYVTDKSYARAQRAAEALLASPELDHAL
jgi:hypothetical protein